MKIALCAAEFVNGDTQGNIGKIKRLAEEYSGRADMLCFGEAFVQGFDGLTWNYEKDVDIAVSQDSPEIEGLRNAARRTGTALGFGYMERAENRIYSGYMVISAAGEILSNYRRMSAGWKIPGLCDMYAEGDGCCRFEMDGKCFSVMLCGDMWTDDVAEKLKGVDPDAVLWPVYTDFPADEWNGGMKHEYAERAALYCRQALYVNCVCGGDDCAKGGAAHFAEGRIVRESPAGGESVLLTEV